MLDGCSGKLVTKDWNAQRKNSIYLSLDRTEIYFIGSIYLLYMYIRKIEGVEPTTPSFFQGYCGHSCFGAGHMCCASWHKSMSCMSSTWHNWILRGQE